MRIVTLTAAVAAALLVAAPGFAQTAPDSTKQPAQSLAHEAPTKQQTQSLAHEAPTKQQTQSFAHEAPPRQQTQSLTHSDSGIASDVTKQH
jgi:hypothetical protein